MSFNFFVNATVDLSHNTQLYVQNITPETPSNYVITVDLGVHLNDLFTGRNYIQNVSEDYYDTNLNVNNEYILARLNGDYTQLTQGIAPGSGLFATVDGNPLPYYVRLLEIMALQIFGHAKARAAIANDESFRTSADTIQAFLSGEFDNQSIRNDFFEQYVQLDRVDLNANDVNGVVDFNLADSQISFIAMLKGKVLDTDTAGDVNQVWSSSLPGSLVSNENGEYNIQILTRLDGLI